MYSGQKCTEDGVVFISGGCCIKVRCIERFPLSSPSTFKLSTSVLNENAEGALHSSSPQMQAPRLNQIIVQLLLAAKTPLFTLATSLVSLVWIRGDDLVDTCARACMHMNFSKLIITYNSCRDT